MSICVLNTCGILLYMLVCWIFCFYFHILIPSFVYFHTHLMIICVFSITCCRLQHWQILRVWWFIFFFILAFICSFNHTSVRVRAFTTCIQRYLAEVFIAYLWFRLSSMFYRIVRIKVESLSLPLSSSSSSLIQVPFHLVDIFNVLFLLPISAVIIDFVWIYLQMDFRPVFMFRFTLNWVKWSVPNSLTYIRISVEIWMEWTR